MPEIPLLDFVMACRFGYYLHAQSYVPDATYDQLEREAREIADFDHPVHEVGSSKMDDYESYPAHVRALSLYLRLRVLEEGGFCGVCHKPLALGVHTYCH